MNANRAVELHIVGGLLWLLYKSNSTAGAVQEKVNLQEELGVHLHFRKLKFR